MRLVRSLRKQIDSLFRRSRAETDLDSELRDYVERETERHLAAGFSREEARRNALQSIGGIEQVKEKCRDARGWVWLESTIQDIRYGLRALIKNPLFSAMAVLSLALGIGANTAIYSVMDAIMLRALPVRNANELMILNWRAKDDNGVVHSHSGTAYDGASGGIESPDFPWPVYELVRDHNTAFSTVFAFRGGGELNVVVHGQAEVGQIELVSGNFFSGLGIVPAAGRLIGDTDNVAGASQVAVLSYNYWRERFNGDTAAIGQTVTINNLPFTIAGVAAPEFFGLRPGSAPVVYVPMVNRPVLAKNYGNERETMFIDPHFYWVTIVGRLRPGITLARAEAELAPKFHQFVLASAENDKERAALPSLWVEQGGAGIDSLRRRYSKPLFVLMGMVALILAIACANIADLLLARATARRREIAVRLGLGASRLRVVRQLLTESLLLAVAGGILGLGVAAAGIRLLLVLLAGSDEHFALHAGIDWRILALTIAIAVATGILFGLAPAIQATRVDVTPALKETRASAPAGRGRFFSLGRMLVVFQIALSLLLVLGAAIFVRTLGNLHSVALGFNEEHLLTFQLDASLAGYKDAALRNFSSGLEERFRIVPGVRAVTVSSMRLVAGGSSGTSVTLPGAKPEHTQILSVGPTFFETMQIPILLGRAINERDVDGAPLAAVANEAFAKKFLPGQNPLGKHFQLGNTQSGDFIICGVAKNAHYTSLTEAIPPIVYLSVKQNVIKGPPGPAIFTLRTAGNPMSLAQAVRKVVRDAAPRVPVTGMMTQTQVIDNTIVQQRTFADLCSAFAALALTIACVGLYGSMAYAVSRRTNEIGVRMALGAERGRIVWMVLREVLVLAIAGLAIGFLGSRTLMPAIKSFLFGMKPADAVATILATGILLAASVLAGFAPAMRASRIDPLNALRHE